MMNFNRLGVINNSYQNISEYKRVVTLCSAGCLRSPSAAVVLASPPFNYNTRAAGLTDEYAIIPFSEALAHWADEVVVMEPWMRDRVQQKYDEYEIAASFRAPVVCLDIPDSFPYRDEDLMRMIKERYQAYKEHTDG